MKKKWAMFAAGIILIIFFIGSSWGQKRSQIENQEFIRNRAANILLQEKRSRETSVHSLEVLERINLESLSPGLFKPTYVKFDDRGDIFVLDYSDFKIHKFNYSKNAGYGHSAFGKGRGQGPGELSRVEDFKIYDNKLFLTDQGTGSIEVYSTDGDYIKRIKTSYPSIPRKISIYKNKIIIEPFYEKGKLFYLCDFEGNVIKVFGDYIDPKNPDNLRYHDNMLSDSYDDNSFFYVPYYLGYAAFYKVDQLRYVKATIDGIKNVIALNNREIRPGEYGTSIENKYETAAWISLSKGYILIKARDYENDKTYFDIYKADGFEYILSIKDPPKIRYFEIHDDVLAGVDDDDLIVFNMAKIWDEIKKKGSS